MSAFDGPPPTRPPRFLRQFALTQGRVESVGRTLPLESLVITTPIGADVAATLSPEHRAIRELCVGPHSIAEIAVHLAVHLGIARILVSDLVAHGYASVTEADTENGPDLHTLERLLYDLERL
jgi:hypothetical protein